MRVKEAGQRSGMLPSSREAASPAPEQTPFCHWKWQISAFGTLVPPIVFFNILNIDPLSNPIILFFPRELSCYVCNLSLLFIRHIFCEQLLCARQTHSCFRNRSYSTAHKQMKSLLSWNVHSSWGYRQLRKDKCERCKRYEETKRGKAHREWGRATLYGWSRWKAHWKTFVIHSSNLFSFSPSKLGLPLS